MVRTDRMRMKSAGKNTDPQVATAHYDCLPFLPFVSPIMLYVMMLLKIIKTYSQFQHLCFRHCHNRTRAGLITRLVCPQLLFTLCIAINHYILSNNAR